MYVSTQKSAYIPKGPTKQNNVFRNEFSSKEKKHNAENDVKIVVMMPLMKLAKLTLPVGEETKENINKYSKNM